MRSTPDSQKQREHGSCLQYDCLCTTSFAHVSCEVRTNSKIWNGRRCACCFYFRTQCVWSRALGSLRVKEWLMSCRGSVLSPFPRFFTPKHDYQCFMSLSRSVPKTHEKILHVLESRLPLQSKSNRVIMDVSAFLNKPDKSRRISSSFCMQKSFGLASKRGGSPSTSLERTNWTAILCCLPP